MQTMTLDELLADLKAKHGDEWPKVALDSLLSDYCYDSKPDCYYELWDWCKEKIAAGVKQNGSDRRRNHDL